MASASSSKNPLKRLGFKRTTTNDDLSKTAGATTEVNEVDQPTELRELDETGRAASVSKIADTFGGHVHRIGAEDHQDISEAEANRKLKRFRADHAFDPNLPDSAWDAVNDVTREHDAKGEAILVDELIEDSPYPEVRAVVRNYDEDVPASTFRAWFIGMLMTTVISGVNALFYLRYPSIVVTSYVVQLISYPMGLLMARFLPNRVFSLFGFKFNLNPGPFNVKEHIIIVAMANAAYGGGTGYFVDTVVTLRSFYKISSFSWGFNIMFALSTQCLGFGLAGMVRKWLVEPAAMIWPAALVNVGFMYALHDHKPADPAVTNGWSMTRFKWFMIMMVVMFCWEWFPYYIIPAFSYFAWITWIKPESYIVNTLFGQVGGISLGFPFTGFTLDWANINSFYNSPLIAPWHAMGNTAVGIVFFLWILVPALHFSGVWYAEYLPINANKIWDNTASRYNISRILTPEHIVDPAKYNDYSPLYLSTSFAVTYGTAFATIAALVSHTYLYHGQEIWNRWKAARGELDDVHMKIMRKYKLVPFWWYFILLVVMTVFMFVSCLAYPTGMGGGSVVLALVIATVFIIPIGIIQAMTNIQLGLNVFTEFIIGYLQPGHPIAMMLFKTFGYIVMTQALYFCQDLKLGHYMHVPQRTMFMAQVIATIWSCLVQLGTVEWALGNIKNICTSEAANMFNCNGIATFYNASVIWGAIGPAHLFSGTALYKNLQYFWLIGFAAPFITYGLCRAFPKVSILRKISMPLFFACMGYVPPYSAMNILAYCLVGYIFNKWIRDKYRGWWMEYNYITSAAWDIGLALCAIAIFFFLQLENVNMPNYWGTLIVEGDPQAGQIGTYDQNLEAVRTVLGDGETFGPKPIW
ncbi:Hypothetical protein R9X50_00513600 [Acrodontium crateriforme]|uniref:Uncharacterized protein n=1 Tax=Acrodontium crateriforme TaxID=150365 RepID=A0AAQ3RBA1_9PEZI|nr:Hypothetical protein R9X50_00513600 [Acrodontium crateriforme]